MCPINEENKEITFLKKMIEEIADRSIQEVLGKFSFSYFKKLASPTERILYAEKMLPEIGHGSSRSVYAMSGGKVLKIARNTTGYAQNHAEFEISHDPRVKGAITHVYDEDREKFAWIVSEVVNPIKTHAQFAHYAGIPFPLYVQILKEWNIASDENGVTDPDEFFTGLIAKWEDRLADMEDEHGKNQVYIMTEKRLNQYKQASKSHFIKTMMLLINEFLSIGDVAYMDKTESGTDFDTVKHYGYTVNGNLVLLDYGLSHEVGDKHYNDKGRIQSRQDVSSMDKEVETSFE